MDIFRQDKIELTKSDYQMAGAYLVMMWIWLGYRFYVENISIYIGFGQIILNTVKTIGGFYLLKLVVEHTILQRGQWYWGLSGIMLVFILTGSIISIFSDLIHGQHLGDTMFPLDLFIIRSFNTALFDLGLFIGIIFSKKSYDQFINNKNLAIQNRENALKILRSQFSPHFLFNNLNTIDALIDDRPAVAKQYVSHLASLYRYLTDSVDQDVMPLEEELAFTQNYLFLIKVRFGEDYRFAVQIEQPTDQRFLPSGALQTALENVVKHNAIDEAPILTTIRVANEVITITNNKGGHAKIRTSGTGLNNLSTRYNLLGGPALTMEETAEQFILTLPLLLAQTE
ncbi:MAG: sensor histidine kinase [Bacteroidota bacterium]